MDRSWIGIKVLHMSCIEVVDLTYKRHTAEIQQAVSQPVVLTREQVEQAIQLNTWEQELMLNWVSQQTMAMCTIKQAKD